MSLSTLNFSLTVGGLIFYLYGCGGSLSEQNELAQANRVVTQALQMDMVELFVESRSFDAASPLAQKLYQENPKDAQPAYLMGVILREKGVYVESEKYFLEALIKDNKHAKTYDALGILYGVQGQLEQSIKAHKQAIKIEPKNAKFWNNYGFALSIHREFEKAIKALQRSLSIVPSEQRTFVNLAFVYGALGQDKNAKHYLSQVLSPVEVYFNLGVIQEKRGDLQIALKNYQKAFESNQKFDVARQAFDRLKNHIEHTEKETP